MTSINAGAYQVQYALNNNSAAAAKSMQRLASGNASAGVGERGSSMVIAAGKIGQNASIKGGIESANVFMTSMDYFKTAIDQAYTLLARMSELNTMAGNGSISAADNTIIDAEIDSVILDYTAWIANAKISGQALAGGTFAFNTVGVATAITTGAVAALTASATAAELKAGTGQVEVVADMVVLDTTLEQIASAAYSVGAIVENLTNMSAANNVAISNYLDVDFAAETTKLAKSQILSQAGSSMLAQANAQGQSMLALLQG